MSVRFLADGQSLILSLIALLIFAACKEDAPKASPGAKPMARETDTASPKTDGLSGKTPKLHTIDDTVLLTPKVDLFESLSKNERRLAHILSSIADEVNVQAFRQNGTSNETIRQVLLGILAAGGQVPFPIRNKITQYTNLFLLNQGTHHRFSHRPFRPQFIPGELAAAAQIALDKGISLGMESIRDGNLGANQIEQLETLLRTIRPWLYEADQIDAGLPEKASAPSSSAKRNLVQAIETRLSSALPYMDKETKAATEKLLLHLNNGDSTLYREYKTQFAMAQSNVEFFLDSNHPAGISKNRGDSIRAVVAIRDPDASKKLVALGGAAPLLEQSLPIDDRFKRKGREVAPQVVGAYNALSIAGVGSLPANTDFRVVAAPPSPAEPTQKYMFFTNLFEARSTLMTPERVRALSFDEATAVRSIKYGVAARRAHLVIREIIGRNSGKMSQTRKGNVEKYLKETTDFIEEARAESVALYLALDPQMVKLGIIPNEECAKTIYDEFLFHALELSAGSPTLESDQVRIQVVQMLLKVLLDAGAAEIALRDGNYYARVLDYGAMQGALGRFLKRVQRIKSTGNYILANELQSQLKPDPNPIWRQNIHQRVKVLLLSRRIGYLFPILSAKHDSAGRILDIEVRYPKDLIDRALQTRVVAKESKSFVL